MADPPRIVAANPWSSLRAWLDDDGTSVYLNIGPPTGKLEPRQSVWVRNNGPAPVTHEYATIDPLARLAQTRATTRHPDGKPLQRGQVLELLWFEEGDGVALMVDGQLEAVLPPWSGRGPCRGYAVEAKGRGPFAWELVVPNPLSQRVARARAHWDALNFGGLFPLVESADRAHVELRVGPHVQQWAVTPPGEPPRRVACFRPAAAAAAAAAGGAAAPSTSVAAADATVAGAAAAVADAPGAPAERPALVYTTLGMASQPMPRIEVEREDFLPHRRLQLALAAVGDTDWVPRLLGELSRYPWRAMRWVGDLHVVDTGPGLIDPKVAPDRFVAVLLCAEPPADGDRRAPSLSGQLNRSNEPVNWLWVLPLTEAERALAEKDGPKILLARMRHARVGWVHDPARASVCDPVP